MPEATRGAKFVGVVYPRGRERAGDIGGKGPLCGGGLLIPSIGRAGWRPSTLPLGLGSNLSHYKIPGQLGAGAMGEVYRARDTKLGREVAIKVLPQHFAALSNKPRARIPN